MEGNKKTNINECPGGTEVEVGIGIESGSGSRSRSKVKDKGKWEGRNSGMDTECIEVAKTSEREP
jgi:hypothetical protein